MSHTISFELKVRNIPNWINLSIKAMQDKFHAIAISTEKHFNVIIFTKWAYFSLRVLIFRSLTTSALCYVVQLVENFEILIKQFGCYAEKNREKQITCSLVNGNVVVCVVDTNVDADYCRLVKVYLRFFFGSRSF